MYRTRVEDLIKTPLSRAFVGAECGDVQLAGPGDILVVKAGEIHSFQAIGDGPLVQLDVHLGPRFIQEDMA